MDFGLQIGHLDIGRTRDVAQAAEALGFAAVYFPDHLVAEGPERQAMGVASYDPFMQAALVAAATTRVRIGHLVLCNLFRHPAVTARSVATLDVLSGGRAVAGLGTGWTETEFQMTGIPFPDIQTRLRMLDEALACLRGLWGEGSFSFAGEFYRFRDASLLPRPVQRPHPEILIGGSGRGALRIAARHADHMNVIADVGRAGYISIRKTIGFTGDAFAAKVAFLRDEATRAGRDPRTIRVSTTVFTLQLADSEAEARTMAEGLAGMFGVPADAVLQSPLFLLGTPDGCVAELRRRAQAWGLAEVILSFTDDALLERFAREVMARV